MNKSQGILEWLNSLPDITEDEIEEQMINWDKFMIEQQDFEDWLKNENSNIELIEKATGEQFVETETRKRRISLLKDWASENGFMQSALKRYRKEM